MISNHPFLALLFLLLILVVVVFVVLILLGVDEETASFVCLCIEGALGLVALIAMIVGLFKKDDPE